MGIVRSHKYLPSEDVLHKLDIGIDNNNSDQWESALYYNLISVAIIVIMALVIFAAMSYQCAATWRWIKDKTCRDYSETDSQITKQAAIRISHSLPDLQTEPLQQEYVQEHKDNKKVLRQTTLPIVPTRHQTFQRQLSHRLEMPTTIQFSICSLEHKSESSLVGLIKPELYKKDLIRQSSADSAGPEMEFCGILHFSLKYDKEVEGLVVKVFEARDLPVKDVTGSSDPYIKIYLLPDRKKKFQTKVHRKNLNPVFNETFIFSVSYEELRMRYVQFSVYDFDRFSRHDLIGHVVLKGLLENTDLQQEMEYTMNILCPPQDKVDLGELMLSLCYLPTAGRLTVTVIKGRNLKAMDITGKSDPYVKIYLLCQGKRIKKKKTSVKRNTLCPVYNEALVFDVPSENIEDVCLIIKVIDYDRFRKEVDALKATMEFYPSIFLALCICLTIPATTCTAERLVPCGRIGSNELMGCTAIGSNFIGVGKDHWLEMLDNPRKPVAQWYTLTESIPGHIPEGLEEALPVSLSCLHSR